MNKTNKTKKTKPKLKQIEMMPLPHGGKREGAGRKPVAHELKKAETVTIRIDKRLLSIIEKLKEEMKKENNEKILEIEKLLDAA